MRRDISGEMDVRKGIEERERQIGDYDKGLLVMRKGLRKRGFMRGGS